MTMMRKGLMVVLSAASLGLAACQHPDGSLDMGSTLLLGAGVATVAGIAASQPGYQPAGWDHGHRGHGDWHHGWGRQPHHGWGYPPHHGWRRPPHWHGSGWQGGWRGGWNHGWRQHHHPGWRHHHHHHHHHGWRSW